MFGASLQTSLDIAQHLDWLRTIMCHYQADGEIRTRLSSVVFHTFLKHHVAPEVSEGFDAVVSIAPDLRFMSESELRLLLSLSSSDRG